MKLKLISTFLIISATLLIFSACGDDSTSNTKTQNTSTEQTTVSKSEETTTVSNKETTAEKTEENNKNNKNNKNNENNKNNKPNKNNTEYSDYKNTEGYEAYTSDMYSGANFGYDEMTYFCTEEAMMEYSSLGEEQEYEKARKYYKANVRECGDFLITNYGDGICINKYIGKTNDSFVDVLEIPETLDGKPVVRLGCYIHNDTQYSYKDEVVSAFGGITVNELKLPKTLKYISYYSLIANGFGLEDEDKYVIPYIKKISVDKANPNYSSENGVLYTKDKNTLIFLNYYDGLENYIVPDFIYDFKPMYINDFGFDSITFWESIGSISTEIYPYDGESKTKTVIKGYTGTVAEEWAQRHNYKFEALD